MFKAFLLGIMSLWSLLCVSQEMVSETPPEIVSMPDSNYFISDLVHIIKDNSKVIINWKLSKKAIPDFFAIERSSNGREYEVVSIIRLTDSLQWFEFVDESPAKGKNLYRIRCGSKDSQHVYSKSVLAQIAGDISFKFYPNPVDNILIIRSEDPLDIQLIDAAGKIRISQNKVQGLQTINVSSLEKGVYILRVNNRQANTIAQEKLLKN